MKNNHSKHSNKIKSRMHLMPAIVCLSLCLLSACGQRGSLYIPTAPEAAQRATIVDTLTTPATTDASKK